MQPVRGAENRLSAQGALVVLTLIHQYHIWVPTPMDAVRRGVTPNSHRVPRSQRTKMGLIHANGCVHTEVHVCVPL